jgi:hypothetical protein
MNRNCRFEDKPRNVFGLDGCNGGVLQLYSGGNQFEPRSGC